MILHRTGALLSIFPYLFVSGALAAEKKSVQAINAEGYKIRAVTYIPPSSLQLERENAQIRHGVILVTMQKDGGGIAVCDFTVDEWRELSAYNESERCAVPSVTMP